MASLSLQSMVQQLLYVPAGFGAPGLLHSEQHPQLVVLETPAHLAPKQKKTPERKLNFQDPSEQFFRRATQRVEHKSNSTGAQYVTLQIKIG